MQDVLIPNGILADFFDYWEKLFIIYILDLWYNISEGEPSSVRGEGIVCRLKS